MVLPQGGRGLDPLVGVRRRHPDVGDHHVGPVRLDGAQKRREIGAVLADFDLLLLALERAADSLPDEVRVLGDD